MRVVFENQKFVCICTFEERAAPKTAGFFWDHGLKRWYTFDAGIASKLVAYADEKAKNEIKRLSLVVEAWQGAIPAPKDRAPKPFQIEAARFALSRNKSYLALDPGLGKTICALLIRNALKWPTAYVCPPFLLANVEEEIRKWGTGRITTRRVGEGSTGKADILLVPDSILARPETQRAVVDWCFEYEEKPLLLIVDEAHRFKSREAKRTKALFGHFVPEFDRTVFMSGTPMPNRPFELYPILSHCVPGLIGNLSPFDFGVRYCAGFETRFGWDFSGASNVEELALRIKDRFMLRVRKSEVLPELPPKTEELVFIDEEESPVLTSLSEKILAKYSPEDLAQGRFGEEHLATYRRKLGIEKAVHAGKYIKFLLEQGDEAILVFGHHKDVIAELTRTLKPWNPLVITGAVAKDKRFEIAQAFQNEEKHRVLILNIAAGGVGFNLTRASRVVFAEFSWCGADNDQAIDRAHRIGQDNPVFAQYLVYRNSLDRTVLETVLRKRKSTDQI